MVRLIAHGRKGGSRSILATGLVALALIASACGDDDDDSTSAPSAAASETSAAATETSATTGSAAETTEGGTETTPAAAAATGDPVTVVALIDETGPAPTPEIKGVVQATADAINAEGGLNGHPIELEFIDTRGDAATAQSAIGGLSGATAILLSSPPTETATADSLTGLSIPILGVGYNPGVWGGAVNAFGMSCATNPEFCANPHFFTIATTFDGVVAEQVLGAELAGASKLSTAACAEVDSCAQAGPVFEAVADEVGLAHVPMVRISSTAADYASECIGFIQEGVDFIQISASSGAGVRLIESCLDQGYEGIFGASAGTVGADLLAAPGVLAGGLNAFPWFVDDEPVAEFREIMEAGGVTEEQWGNPTATGMYSALRLLQTAVSDHADASAPLDGSAALAALYQVQDEDLGGLIPPVTFTEDNLDRTRPCFWPFIKNDDGTIENPLGGLTYQCYPE